MCPSWSLRRYRDGDEQAIFDLQNTVFPNWRSLEYWKWKYLKNPAGPPIVWLAEHDNKIIGHYGIIPVRMKVGNMYVTGSFGGDAATHPKYQGKGVFSSLVNRCFLDASLNCFPLTFGFAHADVGPTYMRYERRGHVCFMRFVDKVLNWEPVLDKYVRSKFLSRTAASVFGKVCKSRSTNESFKIERINHFDGRIDRFWEKISMCFEIIVKRDEKYLTWRYTDHPTNKYILYAATKDNEILGYCVLREARDKNLRVGCITDILGFQNGSNVVAHLVERAIRHFEERDVYKISCLMSEKHPYSMIFRKAGFITSIHRNLALYATINLPGSAINEKMTYLQALTLSQNGFLKEKENWFMMSGDGEWWGD